MFAPGKCRRRRQSRPPRRYCDAALAARIHEPSFQRLVGVALTAKARVVKDLGNKALLRRMLTPAMVLEERSRTEAAKLDGMDRQTLRDRAHRYDEAGIKGLKSRRHLGRAPLLTTSQRAELLDLVTAGDANRDIGSVECPTGA
jgi:hypothetical protein